MSSHRINARNNTSASWPRVLCLITLLCGVTGSMSAQVEIIDHVIPTANSFPDTLTLGSDGALWFTEYTPGKIGRTINGSGITEFVVPTAGANPYGITAGPDGALWFTEYSGNKIGRITTQGVFTEYDLALASSFPAQITTGSDGALWFTEFNTQQIGRITTQGVITEFTLPPNSYPIGIALGADGALWFVESQSNKIGRMTTAGVFSEFDVPTAFSSLYGITAGPDGALWFTEDATNKVGRVTLAGVVTEFPANGGPEGIVAGPDGALWYTEFTGVKVGRITTAGAITEYPVANPGFLRGIAVGPQKGIWFAENSTGLLGQVVVQKASLTVTPSQGFPGTSVQLSGSGFAAGETVNIKDEAGPFSTATADGTGAITVTGKLRPAPFGTNTFVATGQTSHRLGIAQYVEMPVLVATPSVVTAGTQVKLTGFAFHSFDSVGMYIDSNFQVGFATADSQGSIVGANSVTFRVPAKLPKGPHTIVGFGDNGATGTAHITVE
jgi:virginiamycin B lyase